MEGKKGRVDVQEGGKVRFDEERAKRIAKRGRIRGARAKRAREGFTVK